MRPLYETSADRANEKDLACSLGLLWNAMPVELPKQYMVDWAFQRGKEIAAFCEIKCRRVNSDTYPSLILSLAKWMRMVDLSKATGLPVFLIVKYADGLVKIIKADRMRQRVIVGGRSDRNDSQDMEPVVEIFNEELKCLKL
jgi:hypothetical protein